MNHADSTRNPLDVQTPRAGRRGVWGLLRRSGRARGGDPRGFVAMDALENRILLGGDHPNFDLPLTPNSGTLIVLDGNTGEGSDTGTIGTNGDQDLFRFVAVADDFVRVWADTVNANGSTLNSRVEVYSLAGPPPIASGSNNGQLTQGVFTDGWAGFVAEAGQTYFVVVMSDVINGGLGSTGDYILRIDGKSEGAISLNGTGEGTQAGNITLSGSDKVYTVTAGDGDAFDSLATVIAKADATDLDSRLDIYDAQGKPVIFNSESGHLSNAFAAFKSSPGSTFYIRARADHFVAGDQLGTGAFTLSVDFAALDVPIDPVVRRGANLEGVLPSTQDSALYTFVAQGSGRSITTVVGLPIPPLPDPAIRLYDSTGKALQFNKLYGAAEIQTTLTGGERYFVVVEAFDDPQPNGGLFGIWFEAHHTFDQTMPIDDHENLPDLNGDADAIRRAFGRATPLVWGDPTLLLDADGLPIGDRSYVVTAFGTGRIQGSTDTDLFVFVPPSDMLGAYGGDDGNEDAALFVGGAGTFTLNGTLGPPNYDAFTQDYLAILDAPGRDYANGQQKWWPVGLGVNGTVRAAIAFDPDGDGGEPPMMVVAGEFTLANETSANRIAAWRFDPFEGRYVWTTLGAGPNNGVNGTVHALAVFDETPDDDQSGPSLYVGGEFTDRGQHIARWSPNTGWQAVAGGVNDTVYAMTVVTPPEISPFEDPFLVVGGDFTDKGTRIAFWDGTAWSNDGQGGVDSTVYALGSLQQAGQDPNGDDFPNKVIVGGDFTNKGSRIASFTWADDGNGNPLPLWEALGAGTNDTVYALATWDRDGDGDDFGPVIAAGGAFTQAGGQPRQRIASWNGAAWGSLGSFNNTVRALTVFTDQEYNPFDIDPFGNIFKEPRLYAGGDFTTADGNPAARIAKFEVDQATGQTAWIAKDPGTTGTVYALAAMNDEIEGLWDRADRTATRLQIVCSPTTESFLNTFLTIYDSEFNVIYTNDTIAPPFPDPSGMIDPSMAGAGANLNEIEGIQVWGGRPYYIQVSGVSGTGRYNLSVRADASMSDDVIGQYFEPDALWDLSPEITLDGAGDGRVYTTLNPSAYNVKIYDPTPSGFLVVQWQEHASIENINDTDMYLFRAPVSGSVEVRINTAGIADQHFERIFDLNNGGFEQTNTLATYNSLLDSYIRVYRNDQSEVVFNDTNAAIAGEYETTYVGQQTRTYFRRDPRVVFEVVAGDTYYIQVGSGQKAIYDQDPALVNWLHATGSYELWVNAEPTLGVDDDHANVAGGFEAMIPINEEFGNPANGTGSLGGTIANVLGNPNDQDVFGFIAPGAGVAVVTINADPGSSVIPTAQIVDVKNNQVVAQGTAGNNGQLLLTFPSAKGDRFVIGVAGAGGSQGAYTVSIAGLPFIDDHSDDLNWLDATELTILDFLGTATAFGTINSAGDTDVFKFATPDFDIATVTVERVGGFLDTFVRVYEISEDPVGHPIHLQIAYNDNMNGNTTDSRVSFSITAPDRTSSLTGNTYNYYYIVVSGSNPQTQSGPYRLTLGVTPTDDHPDAGQFDFASSIIIDPATGLGDESGILEVSGDSDLFQFTAPAGGFVTIDVAATEGSTVRPRLSAFDAGQQTILDVNTGLAFDEGDDAPPSAATFTFQVVRNQTYFILVEGVSGGVNTGDTGAYTVQVTGPTADDHPNITEFSLATTVNLSVLTGNGLSSGVIEVAGDTDLFRFVTWEAGTHVVTISTPDSGIAPRLRIYDGAQTLVADAEDGGGQDEDGSANGSVRFTINAGDAGQTWYFLVSAGPGGDDTGSYTASVDGQPPENPPPGEGDDHADAGEFDFATPIALSALTGDGSALGTIETPGDTDLFVFSSLASGLAFVQVVTPKGALLDAAVRIFDPSRSQIAFDSQGVPGATASTSFQVAGASQLYYIQVDGLGNGVGSYRVLVNTQPEVNYLFFPEGFVNPSISEFVSIANPNDVAVTYTVTLHYANENLAPVVLADGEVLEAGARGGLTLARDGQVFFGIAPDQPYSLVITSSQPLGATFAHYDFGQALGESFTERTSTTWTFARAERLSGFVNDFIVLFNPNDTATTVTLTAFTSQGTVTLQQTVQAHRRGGWNLDAESGLPQEAFGIRLTSAAANGADPHIGIVAALAHYGPGEGDLTLGDPDGGTTAGILPSVTYAGAESTPQLTFFNPSNSAIAVTIRGSYINANLPNYNRILTVQGRSAVTLAADQIGLILNQPIGLRYTSTGPVTVLAREATLGDSNATQAGTGAGSEWFFGDGFINAGSAGVTYFETLNFYNPDASSALPVTVTLFFNDGTQASTTVNVKADGFAALKLHTLPAILNRGGLNFFSIQVSAARPFITSMTHYDLFLGGGWTTSGAPLGILSPMEAIL